MKPLNNVSTEKNLLQESIVDLELKKKESEEVFSYFKRYNISITLAGQQVAPEAFTKPITTKLQNSLH